VDLTVLMYYVLGRLFYGNHDVQDFPETNVWVRHFGITFGKDSIRISGRDLGIKFVITRGHPTHAEGNEKV
jgi:hypothetical protein